MGAFERIFVTGDTGFVGGHLCGFPAKAYPQATTCAAAASGRTLRS